MKENTDKSLQGTSIGKDFSSRGSNSHSWQVELSEIKKLLQRTGDCHQREETLRVGETVFANYTSDI